MGIEGLVWCYRTLIIIRGIMRLFYKYLKVPRSHFKFCVSATKLVFWYHSIHRIILPDTKMKLILNLVLVHNIVLVELRYQNLYWERKICISASMCTWYGNRVTLFPAKCNASEPTSCVLHWIDR